MSDAGNTEYVPDRLFARLFQPWTLPESEWPLCKEDWARVDAITRLPWKGHLLDFGAGDGTLAAMVASRNPLVVKVRGVEQDRQQCLKADALWEARDWPVYAWNTLPTSQDYDGALCCEVLEHMTPEEGHEVFCDIRRVLKPGSMLCVTVPWESGTRAVYPGHVRQFSWALLGKMLREAGFTLDEKLSTDIKGIWLMAVCHA
jgi:2-polyprenyl-3-methyl-5-hydroxy-6-metoxy-1,4-benzoquinol methylase